MAKTVAGKLAELKLSPPDLDELASSGSLGLNRRVAAMLAQFADVVYKPYGGEIGSFTFGDDLAGFVRDGGLKSEYSDFILMSTFRTVTGASFSRSATLFGLVCLRLSALERNLLEIAAAGGVVGSGLRRQQKEYELPDADLKRNHVRSLLRRPRAACRREVVVVFRGTQSGQDWLTDFAAGRTTNPFGDGLVHDGFLAAYDACRLSVRDAVRSVVGTHEGSWLDYRAFRPLVRLFGESATGLAREAVAALARNTALYVTGHSLGGGLATLCTADLSRDFEPVLYSFGSPRVGSHDFARWFDRAVASRYSDVAQSLRSWRVHRPRDIVTMVPDKLRFRHVGNTWSLGTYLLTNSMVGADIGKPDLPGSGAAAAVGHDMSDYSALVLYKSGLA